MSTNAIQLDEYWHEFTNVLQDFSPAQQNIAVTLYRALAQGKPLTTEHVAAALKLTSQDAAAELERDPIKSFLYKEDERIVGFGGISTAPMHHEFRVNGETLWTWCAWDGLFIPTVLGATAELSSPDPQTGRQVIITVSPDRVLAVEPKDAVVSFLLPDASVFDTSATNVMAQFCHHVFFFESQGSADQWRANKKGTFLFSVNEAFDLGQRLVLRQFGNELERRSAA